MLGNSRLISFLATSNPAKARDFYERILGLTFLADEHVALVLEADKTMVRLQKVDKVVPHPYTALGWEVTGIAGKVRALAQRGVGFERYKGLEQDKDGIWTSPAGARVAWFTDPDGNILSLSEI